MRETILITGAGSMVAKQLLNQIENHYNVRFLSRSPVKPNEFYWNISKNYIDPNAFVGVNHIIHLAGASISKRWTTKRKKEIVSSRVEGANLILNQLLKLDIKIDTYISASAVGYYGNQPPDVLLTEESSSGTGFLSSTCRKWEQAAEAFKLNKVAKRISILRLGIVLSKQGGFLKRIIPPIKFNLGAVMGNGKQFVPWIHIEDISNMIHYILGNNDVYGTFNAVSPEHVTNMELTKVIAESINRRVLLPNIPKFIIRLIFGEMSTILIEGNKVSADRIMSTGFVFRFEKLSNAIKNSIRND